MQPERDYLMDKTKQVISVTELRALVTAIMDNGSKICIRFRLVGGMWHTHYTRVLARKDDFVMLHDEPINKAFAVNLSDVMQFEIDGSIYGYKPNYHYDVRPF